MTGNPDCSQKATASSVLEMGPSEPGTTGTPDGTEVERQPLSYKYIIRNKYTQTDTDTVIMGIEINVSL